MGALSLTRRELMLRLGQGAALGAVAWVTPSIVTADRASASVLSSAPGGGTTSGGATTTSTGINGSSGSPGTPPTLTGVQVTSPGTVSTTTPPGVVPNAVPGQVAPPTTAAPTTTPPTTAAPSTTPPTTAAPNTKLGAAPSQTVPTGTVVAAGATPSSATPFNGSGLPFTGANLLEGVTAGSALTATGAALIKASRRRARHQAALSPHEEAQPVQVPEAEDLEPPAS